VRAGFIPVGWYQLKHQKFRLLAALAGITFAVILMLVQQGFREALFVSSVRWHSAMDYDLVIVSPKTDFLLQTSQFPRNRLVQAAGFEGVSSVTPVYLETAEWRNPVDPANVRKIFVIGFDPVDAGFESVISASQNERIRLPDKFMFDALSRPEFGPVAELMAGGRPLAMEVNGRGISIEGLFRIGTSFGIDGALVTSDLNFQRLFPQRAASHLSLGLIHLEPGVDLPQLQKNMITSLPDDVLILTKSEFKAEEIAYWNGNTPIGYVFTFGVIMGFVVGIIIVYQILYSDVQDHIKEYATLKAMGYTNAYLSFIVIQEAVILAVLGFFPGALLARQLFQQASAATNLPLELTPALGANVLGLTLFMCIVSGMIAVRKLRSADPADVF
jgi:putative ABC transport system permease protein